MMSGDRQKHIKKKKMLETYARDTSCKYQHGLNTIHFRANYDARVLVKCVLNRFKSN